MAIGQRIKFFRNRKGLTQKQFGEKLGFLGKTSDVRITQYESEVRVPKADLVKEMSDLLDVAPRALTVPDIDTQLGLMHTLFAIEDMYGLKIDEQANLYPLFTAMQFIFVAKSLPILKQICLQPT